MKKLSLTQSEIDKLVVVGRRVVAPTVYGVGFNDVDFKTMSGGKQIWQYKIWYGMLQRCFDQKEKDRHPSCRHNNCSGEWLSFANFLEWANKEVGYSGRLQGMQLDKDLIVKGNRIYSPECCSFVPQAVNLLLTDRANHRGEFPVGVHKPKNRKKFQVMLSTGGKLKGIGTFDTPEEAFLAYKTAKEAQIKTVANQYRDVLKPAVYESLMNWEIEP